jgi:DNA-binding response OmpR family regulator
VRILDILVVDDERDLASGVADMLEAEGHNVTQAHSAEAALEFATARVFDAVFLDVKLPGMTGVEILLPLRRAMPGKRIVPMTGYRIDNLLATVVGDDNFMVLSGPATESQVSQQLRDLGPGGVMVLVDSTGRLGQRLAENLRERGGAINLARTEAEALELGSLSGSDVLILDLGRTIVRGLEAYLAVRESGFSPKTIVIARAPEDGKATANPLRLAKVSGCLFKPFDPTELLEIVWSLSAELAPPSQTAEATK